MSFRTVIHGTCALAGRHSSEEHAAECPALGRNVQERLEAFRGRAHSDTAGSPFSPSPTQATSVKRALKQ